MNHIRHAVSNLSPSTRAPKAPTAQTPKLPEMPEMLELSDRHLPAALLSTLPELSCVDAQVMPFATLVRIPKPLPANRPGRVLPQALRLVMRHALDVGCELIMFSPDAPVEGVLPLFEH